MARKKNPSDPSTPSAAWEQMAPSWRMVETLLGGTRLMREAGQEYLPKHPHEPDVDYQDRLSKTTLFNVLEMTLDTLVGKPFSEPVVPGPDVPDEVSSLLGDVDLQGTDLSVFAREWFKKGLSKALAHVLIDMPKLPPEERDGRTLADDLKDGRRPYWVLVDPENVLAMRTEIVNGEEKLSHVRIWETFTETTGFTEMTRARVRVLEPGTYSVYEERPAKKGGKPEWQVVENGETGIDFVPLVTFYSNRKGLMLGKPPLEDLAYLNVRHWQSSSDQANILTVARFPILAASGVSSAESGGTVVIGPRKMLGTTDPQGKFYYVEHSGAAISAGRQDMLDLEHAMASYGAEFLKRRPVGMIATGRVLDSAESTSYLRDMVVRFRDSLKLVLDYTARWRSVEDGGSVKINAEFAPSGAASSALRTILEARKNRDLSREDFLERLREIKVLGSDFDSRKNAVRLRAEMAAAGIGQDMLDDTDLGGEGGDAS